MSHWWCRGGGAVSIAVLKVWMRWVRGDWLKNEMELSSWQLSVVGISLAGRGTKQNSNFFCCWNSGNNSNYNKTTFDFDHTCSYCVGAIINIDDHRLGLWWTNDEIMMARRFFKCGSKWQIFINTGFELVFGWYKRSMFEWDKKDKGNGEKNGKLFTTTCKSC